MRHKFLLITILIVSGALAINGQRKPKEINLEGITAEATGSADMSPAQVLQLAINKAKTAALSKAGIEEDISSYTDYFRAESDGKMEELFTSEILSNIQGSVKNVKVTDKQTSFENEIITCRATINCTVVKYNTKPDKMFNAKVDGIKMFYKVDEALKFTLTPTKDCYLRAFWFTPTEAFVLYPNPVETSIPIKAGETKEFPYNAAKYEITSAGVKKEPNRIVMVLLKKDYPFGAEVNYRSITEWIFDIAPDERLIKTANFDVIQNN
jgi:hypothetical protein